MSTVPPIRLHNSAYRSREYLTHDEVDALMEAAQKNRYGHRDATMILICYRHGFRASELCALQWSQFGLVQTKVHIRRLQGGSPSLHPLQNDEVEALRKLRQKTPDSDFVFMSERGGPFTTIGFAALIKRAGAKAGLPFKVHPQMLRNACGYKLANDGHDTRALQHYMGHRNPRHTLKYFEPLPVATIFDGFWS